VVEGEEVVFLRSVAEYEIARRQSLLEKTLVV
jgi:hypothetical protein